MKAPRNVNDGSNDKPKLLIYGNNWGLMELPKMPHDKPWTQEETLDRLQAAGFHGYQGGPGDAEAVRKRGMRLCTSGRVNAPAEADGHLKMAKECGADCTTLHVGWGMESDAEIDALVRAVLEASEKYDVPAFIETHRATIAQDMWRIVQFIQRTPEVRFNGDFSHIYCGQEMPYGDLNAKMDFMDPIFQRVGFFHGRISDGQCMQADVGDGTDNPHAKHFQEMWKRSMKHWLKTAKPGDVLPFTPELGPPSSRYSIVWKGEELSDRWQQTLVIRRLAEEAFAAAQREVGA
jgi:hypothetical protein